MSCFGNQASPFSINLPPGTVDSNGNNTLDCCECPCGSACAPVVLSNQWAVPNGGTISFASAFSASYASTFANCPNMAWVMNGWNGGGGYGDYVNGTFDANGNMVIGQINDDSTSFDAGSSTLTSYYDYSDAVSIVAYDASASPECSPRTPPNPPSICGFYREPGNSYDYPAFLCGTPNPGCDNPVGVDQYGTCCACTTTTTTTTTTPPPNGCSACITPSSNDPSTVEYYGYASSSSWCACVGVGAVCDSTSVSTTAGNKIGYFCTTSSSSCLTQYNGCIYGITNCLPPYNFIASKLFVNPFNESKLVYIDGGADDDVLLKYAGSQIWLRAPGPSPTCLAGDISYQFTIGANQSFLLEAWDIAGSCGNVDVCVSFGSPNATTTTTPDPYEICDFEYTFGSCREVLAFPCSINWDCRECHDDSAGGEAGPNPSPTPVPGYNGVCCACDCQCG